MMRSGYLLAEDSPQSLLLIHGLDSLEDVFLKLCVKSEADDSAVCPSTSTSQTASSLKNRMNNNNKGKYPGIPQLIHYKRELTPVRLKTQQILC